MNDVSTYRLIVGLAGAIIWLTFIIVSSIYSFIQYKKDKEAMRNYDRSNWNRRSSSKPD